MRLLLEKVLMCLQESLVNQTLSQRVVMYAGWRSAEQTRRSIERDCFLKYYSHDRDDTSPLVGAIMQMGSKAKF